jgi:DNA polymerase III alpha subunit
MTEAYVKRRNGSMPVVYAHPDMEPILKDTYGVAVFQEQLQQMFQDLAGYSSEEADYIRELVSKKKLQDMEKIIPELKERLTARGWTQEQAQVFVNLCLSSAKYSFNCIDGNQKVSTSIGPIPMKEIALNHSKYEVASQNKDGSTVWETPSHGQLMGNKEVIEARFQVRISAACFVEIIVTATEDHEFLAGEIFVPLIEIVQNGLGITVSGGLCGIPLSIRYLGSADVYDIEMPTNHNFVLANGVIAHNCAHSASYGTVAYMCAYLKHHHPAEWWTSVLQNCKIEDIREKGYGRAVRNLLVEPDVNAPSATFEPRADNKVQCPLWLIDGIGESASSAIARNRPENGYVSVQDLIDRTPARALNAGVFKKLAVAGSLSSVAEGKSEKEMIREFLWVRRAQGLKAGEGKKGDELSLVALEMQCAADPDEIARVEGECKELSMDDLELARLKSEILPVCKGDVHDMFRAPLSKYVFYAQDGAGTVRKNGRSLRVLRNQEDLADFHATSGHDTEACWVGLLEAKDNFDYRDKKSGDTVTACKMKVWNSGESLECIAWPGLLEDMKGENKRLPSGKGIAVATGRVKESRTPGQWSMSLTQIFEI